jgi:hypothetical protein
MNRSAKAKLSFTRLEVFTAVKVTAHVLWDMTLCGCQGNPDFLKDHRALLFWAKQSSEGSISFKT